MCNYLHNSRVQKSIYILCTKGLIPSLPAEGGDAPPDGGLGENSPRRACDCNWRETAAPSLMQPEFAPMYGSVQLTWQSVFFTYKLFT